MMLSWQVCFDAIILPFYNDGFNDASWDFLGLGVFFITQA